MSNQFRIAAALYILLIFGATVDAIATPAQEEEIVTLDTNMLRRRRDLNASPENAEERKLEEDSAKPTSASVEVSTLLPTAAPSLTPGTSSPTFTRSSFPTVMPTTAPPTGMPSNRPSPAPTAQPSASPTSKPTISLRPSISPTSQPTSQPSLSFKPSTSAKPSHMPSTSSAPTTEKALPSSGTPLSGGAIAGISIGLIALLICAGYTQREYFVDKWGNVYEVRR